MAAVTTSTVSTATASFNGRRVDRCADGTLWTAYRTQVQRAADTATDEGNVLAYSKDGGATWTTLAAKGNVAFYGTRAFSLFIDQDDYAHVVYKRDGASPGSAGELSGASTGSVFYHRGTPNAGRTAWTWSAAVLFGGRENYNFPDVTACRNPATGGWDAFVVSSYAEPNAGLVAYGRFAIGADGVIQPFARDGLAQVNSTEPGRLSDIYSAGAHTYPSIDFNHTGDGKTVAGGTPHLYVGWTAGATGAGKGVRFRKAVYTAGAWTWNAEREIDPNYAVINPSQGLWLSSWFDGTRAVLGGYVNRVGGVENAVLWDRDAADSTTTTRLLLGTTGANAASSDYLLHGSAGYDTAGNVYMFGRDLTGANGTRSVNRRLWTRATATLGPIVTIDATGNDTPYLSARRGTQGGAVDVVWTDGTASPYTVQHDRLVLPPATPYVPAIML